MNGSSLVAVFDDDLAAQISTFQIRGVEAKSMAKLCNLVTYLAENRSLQLAHLAENEELGIVTAYLLGGDVSLELLKARVETVFPDLEVSLAPGLGRTYRRAA